MKFTRFSFVSAPSVLMKLLPWPGTLVFCSVTHLCWASVNLCYVKLDPPKTKLFFNQKELILRSSVRLKPDSVSPSALFLSWELLLLSRQFPVPDSLKSQSQGSLEWHIRVTFQQLHQVAVGAPSNCPILGFPWNKRRNLGQVDQFLQCLEESWRNPRLLLSQESRNPPMQRSCRWI